MGEALLIVFSVLLALIATEYINNLREKEATRNTLKNVRDELSHNENAIQEMNTYNLMVLAKIDSALVNKKWQNEMVSNDELDI